MKLHQDPKKCQDILWHLFSHEDQLFSHNKKIMHVPMQHFYQQAMVSKSDWKLNNVGFQTPNKVSPQ